MDQLPKWRTSSYSSASANCVEVREHAHGADVRDSQNRQGGYLTFSAPEWTRFLHDLRSERL